MHVAIIMDGNGRWAKARGLPVAAGHKAGATALRKIVPECSKLEIDFLTVYAFSTENWLRSPSEVSALMTMIGDYFKRYLRDVKKNDYRIRVIGDISRLDPNTQDVIRRLDELTFHKMGLTLQVAVNYGGRDEIVRAVRKIIASGALPEDVTEDLLNQNMDSDAPFPDLVIRTGGDSRISNFLLWHIAYSELYISPVLWPDFNAKELKNALDVYSSKERRFGKRL